jgi:hypothetical protein
MSVITEEQSIELEDLHKEIDSERKKHIMGKLVNIFLQSNSEYTKSYNHKSTENVTNTHTEDKNKNMGLMFSKALKGLFLATSATGLWATFKPDILDSQSPLWEDLVENGMNQETVDAAQNFFYKLEHLTKFEVSDLDVLYSNFEIMNNLPPETVHQAFVAVGVAGFWATSKINYYIENKMYDEEKISEYSDSLDFTQNTEDIKTQKNSSLMTQSLLAKGANASCNIGKIFLKMVEGTIYLSNLPQTVQNKIGDSMLKEEKNGFEKMLTWAMKLKYNGYELSSYNNEKQNKEVLFARDTVAESTKHKQGTSSTVSEDLKDIIQNSYENALRRNVKVSFAKALIDKERYSKELKDSVLKLQKINENEGNNVETFKDKIRLKSKISKLEKLHNNAFKIIKSVAKLHLTKSNQLNNHYESLSNLAFLYLENKTPNLNIKNLSIKDNDDLEGNVIDIIKSVDKDVNDIILEKQSEKIYEFTNENIKTFEFNGQQSKSYFKAEIEKEIILALNDLKKQNDVIPITNRLENRMDYILDQSTKIKLPFNEKKEIIQLFNKNVMSLFHDISNQHIKNPIDFNEIIKEETKIIADQRINIVDVKQNTSALSSNLNREIVRKKSII